MKRIFLALFLVVSIGFGDTRSLYLEVQDSLDACLKNSKLYVGRINAKKSPDVNLADHPNYVESMILATVLLPGVNVDKQTKTVKAFEDMLLRTKFSLQEIDPSICLKDSASVMQHKCWDFVQSFYVGRAMNVREGKIYQRYLDSTFEETESEYPLDSAFNSERVSIQFIGQYYQESAKLMREYRTPQIVLDSYLYHLPYYISNSQDGLREACFNKTFLKIRNNLYKYTLMTDTAKFSYMNRKVLDISRQCNTGLAGVCEDVFFVKEKAILSYPTVMCKLREVTSGDLEKDIENMKEGGMEEATRLKHSELLDRVTFCQEANDYGYSWYFRKPLIRKDCKVETN